jgi:pimeloyl-ACP methyl ester carboxylesterase
VNFAVPDAARQLPDEALPAVTVPTLALLAEHSAIMDPRRAADRARALLPDATVEIVPDTGHGLPFDDAERAATRIRAFLDHLASTRPADPDHAI